MVHSRQADYRLKANVVDSENMLDAICSLRPVKFNPVELIDGDVSESIEYGFVAHEVQEVLPSLVMGEKDGTKEDGSPMYQSVNYAGVTPMLVKAVQELKDENDALKAELAAIKAHLGL